MDHLAQDGGRRHEVSVEDGDELAGRFLQTFRQRSGLETLTVPAVVIGDDVPGVRVFTYQTRGHQARLVGGIVEYLDFE
jgi:hypothetical protein